MGHQPSKNRQQRHSQNVSTHPRLISNVNLTSTNSERSNQIQKYDLSKFAVIAVVFNPVKFKSRYEHYLRFEQHMSQSGVNLITVECIFESTTRFGLPRQTFEVTRPNNPRHLQLTAPSILWMKENLINIAVKQLPLNIEYIAWIDADIEFDRLDWPHLAIGELQRYSIVQLFELSFFLGPGGKKDILRRDYSFGYSIRNNKPIDPKHYDEWYAHPGYAWAMRRTAFNIIGGLLDFCIIGSSDLHFAFALLNRIDETIRPNLHDDYQVIALKWASQLAQVAQNGRSVGYVPINLYHYWHGPRTDRNYVDRWTIIEKHQFSPLNDLEKNHETGLIRLSDRSHLRQPHEITRIEALERDIVDYFKSRDEDNNINRGTQLEHQTIRIKPFVAAKTQPHRRPGIKQTTVSSNTSKGSRPTYLWSSGPAGTHVDYSDSNLDQCSCPGHHHHHDNHQCPCSPHHTDDQHCWNPSDHHTEDQHHHHHHHHHHTDDQHHYNPSDYEHHHHQHHTDHHSSTGGFDYNHSGGGTDHHSHGGFGTTDYGGPGSFY